VAPPELVPASRYSFGELAQIFTASFEHYVTPLSVDEATLRRMAELFDFDLDASRVALVDGTVVGLVNVALRDRRAWIGGAGVIPAHRRSGIGELLMHAAHEAAAARGADEVWLEVIASNAPALRLYEKLGYGHVRELEIWQVGPGSQPSSARESSPDDAHRRVQALRTAPEPWQRSDATLAHVLADERLTGLVVDGGAAVVRPGSPASVEQVAAADVAAATDVLAGAASRYGGFRLTNVPSGDAAALACAELAEAPLLRQHELRLELV
jgi:GNAT superfamily N-acetyltransferase